MLEMHDKDEWFEEELCALCEETDRDDNDIYCRNCSNRMNQWEAEKIFLSA